MPPDLDALSSTDGLTVLDDAQRETRDGDDLAAPHPAELEARAAEEAAQLEEQPKEKAEEKPRKKAKEKK